MLQNVEKIRKMMSLAMMSNQSQARIMFGLPGELWRVVPVNIPLLLQEDKVTFGVVCLHYLRLQAWAVSV